MAITLTLAPNGIEDFGNKVAKSYNLVFTTYTSGGENLTPALLGMRAIDFIEIEPSCYGGISLVYDWNATTPKLHAYVPNATPTLAATEVTGGTDISWLGTIKVRVRGIS